MEYRGRMEGGGKRERIQMNENYFDRALNIPQSEALVTRPQKHK